MWYIVRLDSSRVATRHSSHTPHFDEGCDSTRVKSNYIPHILYIVVCEARQTCGIQHSCQERVIQIVRLQTSQGMRNCSTSQTIYHIIILRFYGKSNAAPGNQIGLPPPVYKLHCRPVSMVAFMYIFSCKCHPNAPITIYNVI